MDRGSWRLQDDNGFHVYTRPLGVTELGFYWDTLFSGTADTLTSTAVQVARPNANDSLTESNVVRAWIRLKQWYPLLGARLSTDPNGEDVKFVVSETGLGKITLGQEISFLSVASAADADNYAHSIINGPRCLSNDLLARLYILRRSDCPNVYHVIIHAAHLIIDGMAHATARRTFFDLLARGSSADEDTFDLRERRNVLYERLDMVRSSEDLDPALKMSPATRRWRRAIARVIADRRLGMFRGGHTLPRTITASTPYTPAVSMNTLVTLSASISTLIISTCRRNRITFGHALTVVGQLALSRVLYRRYHRGEISQKEWEARKRSPMHNGGPLNLRPFLDRDWVKRGGDNEIFLAIGFFFCTLPFMPTGPYTALRDGAPPFSKLLSKERFFYRCRMIKKQIEQHMKHPLFLEIAMARLPARIERGKETFEGWLKIRRRGDTGQAGEKTPGKIHHYMESKSGDELVFTHSGSSIGNIDAIVPLDYPLPFDHPFSTRTIHKGKSDQRPPHSGVQYHDTVLRVDSSFTLLRCRPAELYLGAWTSRRELCMNVFWDGNVYEEGLVKEWLAEIKDATVWYLGSESEKEMAKL